MRRECEKKEAELRKADLPPGRFRYEAGSYGGPGGYFPSILGYKETGPEAWTEHLCLAKPDSLHDEDDEAASEAREDLDAAVQTQADAGGSAQEFALSLRHAGYKSVSDFRIVGQGGEGAGFEGTSAVGISAVV